MNVDILGAYYDRVRTDLEAFERLKPAESK